jgi:UDP-N-acetylmuramyl pentapeptide phosphotransferase/UDP-N-acetylglucosamine-1-phosphate transferase
MMTGGTYDLSALASTSVVVVAALLTALLIVVLLPWLTRVALAKPNARSSHRVPTPQGGGIAVIVATLVTAGAAFQVFSFNALTMPIPAIAIAVIAMACLGAAADIKPLPVGLRLLLQAAIIEGVLYAMPTGLHVVPAIPLWIERYVLLIGALWFVNLVNFMDGIDWMTVAEVIPLTAALAILGFADRLPAYATVLSLALGGATAGFAWFNRPVARIFLGDVGSLSIGLILGILLLFVAGGGHPVAALIMPLYYLADATITLLRRVVRGEKITQAHRTHFYQRATDKGFTVMDIVTRVFAINLGLGALAILTVVVPGWASSIAALIVSVALVGWLLFAFERGKA